VSLKKLPTEDTGGIKDKERARVLLQRSIRDLAQQQELLHAQDQYALLIVLQAMDAAGKDSTVKHVMSGVNPQGVSVTSFKAPSHLERDHDYLWRSVLALPRRGSIGIHNRSYYEEVIVTRVHPEILEQQQLPAELKRGNLIARRFEQINYFERYLVENGTVVVKFFLHVSKAEQKKRFLERIERPEKNWKFSAADAKERAYWRDYQRAYEDVLRRTSTEWAPWYVIPADNKWFLQVAVAEVIYRTLKRLRLEFPAVSEQQRRDLLYAKLLLESEGDAGKPKRRKR
jgi:PPK2 family polyphosphate:nucleotide phosphotransferase